MKKIVYAGLHRENLHLLYGHFHVSAIAHIEYFDKHTFNPVNFIFKAIYWMRRHNRCRPVELLMLKIWTAAKPLSSSVFHDYRDYLEAISRNRTDVLDFNHPDSVAGYIKDNGVGLLIVNTWEMLPKQIISAPELGTINVHPSKLPKYRGALPTLWALKYKDTESAITYMLLDDAVDGGNIICQHEFALNAEDNWRTIEGKATEVITATFLNAVIGYIEGRLVPYPQDLSNGSFTDKYERYRKIDWNAESAAEIFNKVNLYPFVEPDVYCFTYYRGRKLFIKKVALCKEVRSGRGKFSIAGLYLFAHVSGGAIKMKLFRDIGFLPSIRMLFQKAELTFS